jgi:prepilin-type N-terminal cleavage/methylation domain-containing protein
MERAHVGFTMLELMIALAIVALLAVIAIPLFQNHQMRSKTAEVKSNLSALRSLEETYRSARDEYLAAPAEPPVLPGGSAVTFNPNAEFTALGFRPEGRVLFSYGVAVNADASGYTADAAADIDGDGFPQLWGFAKPDPAGAIVAGQVGCVVAVLGTDIGPCGAGHGTSVF